MEKRVNVKSKWLRLIENLLSPPNTGTTSVDWQPVREERLRVSRIVRRPISEVERILRVGPAELIHLAYGENTAANAAVVPLQLSSRIRWLIVPVRVEYWTPQTPNTGTVTISWKAARFAGLFPEMEAHLQTQPDGEWSVLVLDGRYRPPFGLVGLLTDRVLGRFIACATAQQFIERLAQCLEQ